MTVFTEWTNNKIAVKQMSVFWVIVLFYDVSFASCNDCQISAVKKTGQNMIVLEDEPEQFVVCCFYKFSQVR